jgi:hypothetical protein
MITVDMKYSLSDLYPDTTQVHGYLEIERSLFRFKNCESASHNSLLIVSASLNKWPDTTLKVYPAFCCRPGSCRYTATALLSATPSSY